MTRHQAKSINISTPVIIDGHIFWNCLHVKNKNKLIDKIFNFFEAQLVAKNIELDLLKQEKNEKDL